MHDARQMYRPGLHLAYLEEGNSAYSLEQILTPEKQALFRPCGVQTPNFGYSAKGYWLRFGVERAPSAPPSEEEWLLELENVFLDTVQIYQMVQGQLVYQSLTGDAFPFAQRPVQYRYFVFPLRLPESGRLDVYLHIRSISAKQFPMRIAEEGRFFTQAQSSDALIFLIMGAGSLLFLYSLGLFIKTRGRLFIFYSFFNLSSLALMLAYNGLLFQYLTPRLPVWNNLYFNLSALTTVYWAAMFALEFLNTKAFYPWVYARRHFLLLLVLLTLCLQLYAVFIEPLWLVWQSVLLSGLAIAYLFFGVGLGLLTIGKNHRPLYYYLMAWLIVFLGGAMVSLRLQGYLSENFLTVHLFQFSYILESLILSLGLGDLIIRQRIEKELMQAETIRLLKENQRIVNEQNQQLESLVRERTEALHASNEELTQNNEELKISYEKLDVQSQVLQQLNATKDRLFAIIGHDLRTPIHSLKGLMELVETQSIAPGDFFNLTAKLRNSVEHVHFTLNNLLQWANAQMQGLLTQTKVVYLYALAEENCLLLQEMAQLKNIQLHNQIHPEEKALADPDHIKLIFRNLLGNALKFTPSGGQVWLKAKAEAGFCVVEVKDTGIGLAPEILSQVFKTDLLPSRRGTAGEKGTGLGLALCQEFVRKNGGKIWVESEISRGTTFYFTLPLSPASALV
ncbi:MAG: hypothetical protein OHK0053_14440 [Microscillaceae bacterium]